MTLHAVQGGSIDYHKASLRNLATAVRQEKRLCAVMLDTVGRELIIRREYTLDEQAGISDTDDLQVHHELTVKSGILFHLYLWTLTTHICIRPTCIEAM